MHFPDNFINKFYSKIRKSGIDQCWPWLGASSTSGYGVITHNDKQYLAHRLSYMLHHDIHDISTFVVMHSCDNPNCVNPHHLTIGSHADNVADKVRKHRQATGENNGRSKLTLTDVAEIKKLYTSGLSYKEIAEKYSVDSSLISQIVAGKIWKDSTEVAVPRPREGSNTSNASLTNSEVLLLRDLHASGNYGYLKLAEQFGVSKTTIANIVRRETWKHI